MDPNNSVIKSLWCIAMLWLKEYVIWSYDPNALFQMVAKGKDASDLFPAVVKNVVSKNLEVCSIFR